MTDTESNPQDLFDEPEVRGENKQGPEISDTDRHAESSDGKDTDEDADEDAASIKTTTDDLFLGMEVPLAPQSESRKLGLSVDHAYGWDRSDYSDFDIIAVHGIRDDWETAWIDRYGDWWVRNQVFKGKSIRQLDYSYEIHEDSMLYEPDGLRRHAQNLITQYSQMRSQLEDTETDRPVIWICHDLGGTIVKEALSMALCRPDQYGKIAFLTTVIIFLGTPHRTRSLQELEDSLLNLILLPGPQIRDKRIQKVQSLSSQVNRVNLSFPATKLMSRARVFNVFCDDDIPFPASGYDTEDVSRFSNQGDGETSSEPSSPFPSHVHGQNYSHNLILFGSNHMDLVGGYVDPWWISRVSSYLNSVEAPLKVTYQILQFQVHLLALAPPKRELDRILSNPLPLHPVLKWLKRQGIDDVSSLRTRPKVLHVHGNDNTAINIADVSRHMFLAYEGKFDLAQSLAGLVMIYFEFDRWDSRYSTISSLLVYLINTLVWRFGATSWKTMAEELNFLSDMRSWSREDLYHLYSVLRDAIRSTDQVVPFISCFDQCNDEDRRWFLRRVLDVASYTEIDSTIIVSTRSKHDVDIGSEPDHILQINLDECSAMTQSESESGLFRSLRISLRKLVERRPVFKSFYPQLEALLIECHYAPYLGSIILKWLEGYSRGTPRSAVAKTIDSFSPPTAQKILQVFLSSLHPGQQQRAKDIFSWVQQAAEPWTPESLTEALSIHWFVDDEPCLEDLDSAAMMAEIEKIFGGIIIIEDRDIKFSHSSFYELTCLDAGTEDEQQTEHSYVAQVNGAIAQSCLRYFWFKNTQLKLSDFSPQTFQGGPWSGTQNGVVVVHPRTSMAEYAVRFWPQHYKASGNFKPQKLVKDLFLDKEARAAWEVPFYTLSNPFIRTHLGYIAALPNFAMLGLDDLLHQEVEASRDHPNFKEDCWLAIAEASRTGNESLARYLLDQVGTVNQDHLSTSLSWAAANGSTSLVDLFIHEIQDSKSFRWPSSLPHRAAALGLDSVITAMAPAEILVDGNGRYRNTTPIMVAIKWNRASTVRLLLELGLAPDFAKPDHNSHPELLTTMQLGNPDMVRILLEPYAAIGGDGSWHIEAVLQAVRHGRFAALDLLLDYRSVVTDSDSEGSTPLIEASERGYTKSVRALLRHGADPNFLGSREQSALFFAAARGHLEIARLLLENDPKADPAIRTSDDDLVLTQAVASGNKALVSLLLEHGVAINYGNDGEGYANPPLARAAYWGDLKMVKHLLDNGADVNYTGNNQSSSALLVAISRGHVAIAKLLLDRGADVSLTDSKGWDSLHASYNLPEITAELLKRGMNVEKQSGRGTILHLACIWDKVETIEALLAHDPKLNLEIIDEGTSNPYEAGCTALLLACMYRNDGCVAKLLKAGANPHFRTDQGEGAIDKVLINRNPRNLESAMACIRLLLAEPYKVAVDLVDIHGDSLLHKIYDGTLQSIVQLLLKAGTPLDTRNKRGETPLVTAIRKQNMRTARYLIEQGADLNVLGPTFGSPLHQACGKSNLDLVKLLLAKGADPMAADPNYGHGESLLATALRNWRDPSCGATVRYLVDVIEFPVNKLGGQFGYPLNHLACCSDSSEEPKMRKLMKYLIRRGANLEASDHQGCTPLHYAARSGNLTALQILTRNGASWTVRDKVGRTALHFAAGHADIDLASYLRGHLGNIDVDILDQDGWTPLLWTARSGSRKTFDELLTRGASIWTRGRAGDDSTEWTAIKLLYFCGMFKNALKDEDKDEDEEEDDDDDDDDHDDDDNDDDEDEDNDEDVDSEKESEEDDDEDENDPLKLFAPKERKRVNSDGIVELWNDYLHKSKPGHYKNVRCEGCDVKICGIQRKCVDCTHDFSLCFKCYGRRADLHFPDHNFEEIGPLYYEPRHGSSSGYDSESSDDNSAESVHSDAGSEETSS